MFASQNHCVQLYRDDADLARNAGRFLREGAVRGDCLIVVATPVHRELLTQQLLEADIDVEALQRAGKLLCFDAEATLSSLLVDGMPDPGRFELRIARPIRELRGLAGNARVRAFGEMVDLLWKDGRTDAAIRLEGLWNRLLESEELSLFCSYGLDLLDVRGESLRRMLCSHSHLLRTPESDDLGRALDAAMGEVLGAGKTAALLPLIRANHLPRVRISEPEAAVLWLRLNLPQYAEEILSRVRTSLREAMAQT